MLEAFRKCFKDLFPGELPKSGAFHAAIEHFDRQLQDEVEKEYKRRAARNARLRKKKRRA